MLTLPLPTPPKESRKMIAPFYEVLLGDLMVNSDCHFDLLYNCLGDNAPGCASGHASGHSRVE